MKKTEARNKLVKICIIGVMAALYFVLENLSLRLGDEIKITFSGLPILITAFTLGPVSGMIAGGIGSFAAQLLSFGLSWTTPLWVLPAIARGLSAGLIFKIFKNEVKIVPIGIATIVSSILVSTFNTLTLYIDGRINHYYHPTTFLSATAFRFLSGIITAVIYMAVIIPLLKGIKLIRKPKEIL